MSDIFVEVASMSSNATEANADFADTMPPVMKEAATKEVKKWKNKGITTKKPSASDKAAKRYSFNIRQMSLKIVGGNLECKLDLVLKNKGSIVATLSKTKQARLPSEPTDEQLAKVAQELVSEATEEITENVLKVIVDQQP